MNSKRRSCLIIAAMPIPFLILAGAAFWLIQRGMRQAIIVDNLPPTLIVSAPTTGESIEAGQFLFADLTATGQNAITRIEFWLDGELLETKTPDPELGELVTFYAVSTIQLTEGVHMFYGRVVDSKGLIGQSLPITIQGLPPTEPPIAIAPGDPNTALPAGNPENTAPATPLTSPTGSPPSASPAPITPPPPPPPISPPNVPALLTFSPAMFDISAFYKIALPLAPKAPSLLQAGFSDCKIQLRWTDNADNESQFKIWIQALGGPARVIATLQGSPATGPAWYEFTSPQVGIYSYWVEAVNAFGSQASEIAWVGVTDINCASGLATHIKIEVVDMNLPGGYNGVYCYLSVEGAPEKRTPSKDGQSLQVLGGWADVTNWTGDGNSFLLPMPADNEVMLEGRCLGLLGTTPPIKLGDFKASVPRSQWDGSRLTLKQINGSGFEIGYRIQPYGNTTARGIFNYTDPTLAVPTNLMVTVKTSTDLAKHQQMARQPTLHWFWTGDAKRLTGFTVFLDGKPLWVSPAKQGNTSGNWSTDVTAFFPLPTSCGGVYNFQVAANSLEAQSIPSTVYRYEQPPCAAYAEVKFETIRFWCLDDGDVPVIPFISTDCNSGWSTSDTIEAYYWLHANGEETYYSGLKLTTKIDYAFQTLGDYSSQKNEYPRHDTFIVPIDPQKAWLRFGLHMKDRDPWYDADDHICAIGQDVTMSYADWSSYTETFKLKCHSRDGGATVTITVKGLSALPASP